MVLQKPMEHIKSEDVNIDAGCMMSDLGITHEDFEWFMNLSQDERKCYLQKFENEKKTLEKSVQQKLFAAKQRGDILISKW